MLLEMKLGVRAAACLLLAVITADVVGDTNCDSPDVTLASATQLQGPAATGANEPCGDVCIPDCFCCSRSVVASSVVIPPEPESLASVDAPLAEQWPAGVRPVVDRPPLTRG
jgi:hypothetical protein